MIKYSISYLTFLSNFHFCSYVIWTNFQGFKLILLLVAVHAHLIRLHMEVAIELLCTNFFPIAEN